jgi:hypothetical protein
VKQRLVYALLAAFAVAAPAAAEPQRLAQNVAIDALPPYEILTIVRSAGLDPLGPPVRRGANYVLHAIGGDDREVRVLVDGRSGGILSITPVMTASRMPPRGVTMGPYERMPPGYIPSEPPGVYQAGPPVDDEPPVVYGTRPPAPVPGAAPHSRAAAPPRVITATPPNGGDVASVEEPDIITEPGRSGMLPPPPERFPQRMPPVSAKPKPVKRTAVAVPNQAPLPKPRPHSNGGASSAPSKSNIDAAPVPPLAPESKPAVAPLPN